MPSLTWSSKSTPDHLPAELELDSILYPASLGFDSKEPENQLIMGDNLRVMQRLLETHSEKIDLIYVDPPFYTNKGYAARVGRGEDSRQPDAWELAEGYQDHWDKLDDYLEMLYHRLLMMYQLLSPEGSLYLHLDWHANSYARILLDEIFGYSNLNNEIIWTYHGPSPIRSAFNRKHDTILFYTKSDQYTFNVDDVRMPYSDNTIDTFKSSKKAGFGKKPNLKRGKVPEDWWYFPVVARLHNERTGYPTQKPESLLERIILASSNPGDLVADFFCGAGTTPSVANRLGRRFLAVDSQWRAVHTARSRLVLNCQDAVEKDVELLTSTPIQVLREKSGTVSPYTIPGLDLIDKLQFESQGVQLMGELASEVDYWEVDPDWDGETFHSIYQQARPWRKGRIKEMIPLPSRGNRVAVRLVTIEGDRYQIIK
jgi:DNA modification methylase